MDSSRDLPSTTPAMKPPANASLWRNLVSHCSLLGVGDFRLSTEVVEIILPSTIGVANLGLVDLMHGELPHVMLALDRHNSRVGALGDDHGPLSLLVLLGQVGNMAGDLGHVLGAERMRVGVRSGLGLVADEVVPVGGGLIERVLEELRNEGRAEA